MYGCLNVSYGLSDTPSGGEAMRLIGHCPDRLVGDRCPGVQLTGLADRCRDRPFRTSVAHSLGGQLLPWGNFQAALPVVQGRKLGQQR